MLLQNIIHCGNAFDLFKKVEDESVVLIVCDSPYGVTKNDWDRILSIQDFNLDLIRCFTPKLKDGGALYLFGKPDCLDFIDYRPFLNLRSRIVCYQPSRLAQGRLNYTNNYDVIHYFIKGKRPKSYNLDAIHVAQLVKIEHRRRCENVPSVRHGQYSRTKFNEDGKNPGDVWGDIKQLTYQSKELVSREALNTIQKPEKLIERIILASSDPGDLVLDPFAGVGTCPVVCKRHGRNFIAFEMKAEFVSIAEERLASLDTGQQILGFSYGT
ncbi:putative methyltransferase [Gloeomargarita lithophora Alchichica-D10]|uniref:Methyltransferase n=1 Tax=Gloeomargarita lithophora Alchichica-D10 TaxID=1188229 RepID=A0A1J0ACI6_9CYAN|nr:DNA methyltransferase [Gloeomargarita lithophora]APB33645.1 putative methyltransferase [Gloeomargarita lithophora Alchichica-D10]